jgi:4a-hydroxytetrahydrobiopterin dehydratase
MVPDRRQAMLKGMAKLDQREAGERLQKLPGWELQGDAIRRTFTFGGFPDAVAFVARLAFDAEAADHHPDLTINYKRVTLTYSTHSAGGLTVKDFDGAAAADTLAARMAPK